VAVVDLERSRAERVAALVRQKGVRALPIVADLMDVAQAPLVFEQVTATCGVPDVLVSIIGQATIKPALQVSPDDWDLEMSKNLRYFFFAAQAFGRLLVEKKQPGSIAAIASVDGIQGAPVHAPYGAAKAGLIHLVKSLAVEWADYGIRVNSVAAGSIVTPRIPETDTSRAVMRESLVPMRRSGEPHEIAGPLLFLSSDLASYVTGQTIGADGGWSAANLFNLARKPELGRIKISAAADPQ